MPVPVDKSAVLAVLQRAKGRPLKSKEVGKELGLTADDRASVREALRELSDDGSAIQLEGRRFVVASASPLARGTVQRKASGAAWFIPERVPGDTAAGRIVKDAFIPPDELLGVMDGDTVLVRIELPRPSPFAGRGGGRGGPARGPVATIVKVVSRRRTTLTGVLRKTGKSAVVVVDGNVISGNVLIPEGPEGNAGAANDGDAVEVLIVEPPTAVTTTVGRIIRSLGKAGQIDVEIERILSEKGVVKAFPPEVTAQAESYPPDPSEEDIEGREDLRDVALCTIDGETAKDFDDAVWAEKAGKDLRVIVAVADVSHYVQQGTPLDVEAARRATSIYYPGRVIPMLPEALSNGLCSLRPDVERLCMCAEMTIAKDGVVKKTRLFEGVMKSQARLTYNQVQKHFDGDKAVTAVIPKAVRDSLSLLREAALALREQRFTRGSLDFDMPETVIVLDDKGEPTAIKPLERLFAHKLIEDLMVAANEAVARSFEEKHWPSIYRIHEQPDEEKLERFLRLARAGGATGTLGDSSPKALSAIMGQLKEHPAKQALDSLLLRSMKQARYSAENAGHYGLGSAAYLHFTSPIRRYPDLVVHRALRDRLRGKRKKANPERDEALHQAFSDVAAQSSEREQIATQIERAVDALYGAWFMRDKVGEEFEAAVTGVAEFGCFVRLVEHHVEGMIRLPDLPKDYYELDEVNLRLVGERSGFTINVGDRFPVVVAGVDLVRRQVAMVPAQNAGSVLGRGRDERPPARGRDDRKDDRKDDRRGRDEVRRLRRGPAPDERKDDAARGRGTPRGRRDDDRPPPFADRPERSERPVRAGRSDGPPGRPLPPAERPKSPDELRALFEQRSSRGELPSRGRGRPGAGGKGGGGTTGGRSTGGRTTEGNGGGRGGKKKSSSSKAGPKRRR